MKQTSDATSADSKLAQLLAEHAIDQPLAEARDLLAGIAAAPTRRDPLEAIRLFDPEIDPATGAALRILADDLAAGYQAGIAHSPAPADRLAALRAELDRLGVNGFIVPRNDEHNGEYVLARAERLAWLTGFTGSAGMAIVLAERAAIFIDGRYTLQAADEVDARLFAARHLTREPADKWLADTLQAGDKLGYDPWLHTTDGLKRLGGACDKAGAELVALEPNPLDTVWHDQPPTPVGPVVAHALEFAGESAADKRAKLAATFVADGIDAAVITLPDSIAWLLNIRGADVPHSPLPLSFAILHGHGGVDLIIDRRKLTPGLTEHLGNAVVVHNQAAFGELLDDLGAAGATVRIDPATAGVWAGDRLRAAGATVRGGADPCILPKAIKNATEIAGSRAAHIRDGVAVTRFLCWLAQVAGDGSLDELAAAAKLEDLRMAGERIEDLSFTTISGAGPNGAIS